MKTMLCVAVSVACFAWLLPRHPPEPFTMIVEKATPQVLKWCQREPMCMDIEEFSAGDSNVAR